MGYVDEGFACDHQGAASLDHGDGVTMVVVVAGDVVAAVAGADYNCVFTVGVFLRLRELRGVDEAVAAERGHARDIRGEVGFSGVPGCEDYVVWVEGSCFCVGDDILLRIGKGMCLGRKEGFTGFLRAGLISGEGYGPAVGIAVPL